MRTPGDGWDNPVVESVYTTLKTEQIDGGGWRTREAARGAVFEYIEDWHNRSRHSALDYVSPGQYGIEPLRGAALVEQAPSSSYDAT